jgi:hypothetical protein
VVAPEVPRGRAVGQAVFHHQPDGQGDEAAGVVAAGRGQVSHVGVEVAVAGGAGVPGVDDLQAARPVAEEAAEVVQGAAAAAVSEAGAAAARARPAAGVAGAAGEEGWREVFSTGDPRGAVRDILSGSHGWLLRRAEQARTVELHRRRNARITQFLCYSVEKQAEFNGWSAEPFSATLPGPTPPRLLPERNRSLRGPSAGGAGAGTRFACILSRLDESLPKRKLADCSSCAAFLAGPVGRGWFRQNLIQRKRGKT